MSAAVALTGGGNIDNNDNNDAGGGGGGSSNTSHFDISQLPSITKGMSSVEEAMKRRKTCRFIEEAGRVLKLPRVAISTAMVFFHRFYAKHAFQEHDRFEVAVAALVLAAKTEEAPKKLNTVIQECYKLKARAMQAGRLSQQHNSNTGGSDTPPPSSSSGGMKASSAYLDTKGEDFLKLKERILLLERIILHTIGFELSIDHPYKFFVDMIKKLISTRQLKYSSSKLSSSSSSSSSLDNTKTSEVMSKMMNELVQYSMSTANDSYQTSLCLQFGPKEIATACVYLACMFSGVEPINGDWKKTLLAGGNNSYIDVESLVSVCIQIIDLIADKKASDTESVRKIRKALELLKSREEQAQLASASANAGSSGGGRSPRPPPPPSGSSGGGPSAAEPSPNKRPRVS
jgi:cyclin T